MDGITHEFKQPWPPTLGERIAVIERDIARLQEQIADQGMMLAQLRELVQGEPPFLQPESDWHINE